MIKATKSSNANVWQSYKSITKYRDEHCTPLDDDGNCAIYVSDDANEIICPTQYLLDHQWKKILQTRPHLKEKIIKIQLENPGVVFRLVFKYGRYIQLFIFKITLIR